MHRKYGMGSRNQSVRHEAGNSCGRLPSANNAPLDNTSLDDIEKAVLEISRYYWRSFAAPATQSWLCALQIAAERFGPNSGGEIGLGVLAAVQAMRMSRSSCFHFNNPVCAGCASILSDDERRFINVFRAVRGGFFGSATTHAMILCEGNDTSALIERMTILVQMACGGEMAAEYAMRRSRAATNG